MSQSKKLIATSLGIFVFLTAGVFMWTATSTSGTTSDAEFEQEMRNALSEVNLATSNNALAISTSPDNLSNFIYNRSGVQFSQANKNSLRQIEEQAWSQSKRITQSGLTDALTQASFEKLVTLSDTDIDNMAFTLTGLDAPDLPPNFNDRDKVMLRITGEGIMSVNDFKNQVKSARNNSIACTPICSSQASLNYRMTRTALRNRIAYEVSSIMSRLGKADANFSEGNTDNLTPTEAMLITYAVMSGDPIAGNQSELQQKMAGVQQAFSQSLNRAYTSSQGRRPFGTNGYLYSSPATLLLDDATTARVITLIKEASDIQ